MLFTIWWLTGLNSSKLCVLDLHYTITYYVVAHFHYVSINGAVFAFYLLVLLLANVKFCDIHINEELGQIHF